MKVAILRLISFGLIIFFSAPVLCKKKTQNHTPPDQEAEKDDYPLKTKEI
jgi:hypothetical protein